MSGSGKGEGKRVEERSGPDVGDRLAGAFAAWLCAFAFIVLASSLLMERPSPSPIESIEGGGKASAFHARKVRLEAVPVGRDS